MALNSFGHAGLAHSVCKMLAILLPTKRVIFEDPFNAALGCPIGTAWCRR